MIPKFPNFKKLALEDKPDIQKYLNYYLPYSDYNFLSLWGYNYQEDIIISTLNDNLVIRFRDYINKTPFYSFMGHTKIQHTIKTLLEFSIQENLEPILKLIPETNFASEFPSDFNIQEDRNNFDYIFSTLELSELTGQKFHNQRNFVNRFDRLYPHCTTEIIDLKKIEIKEAITRLFNKWMEARGKTKKEVEHEFIAIERTIKHADLFKIFSIGIFDGDQLIGFIIADLDHPNYCETHFAKADMEYAGIFYKLYNYLAEELHKIHYKHINNEQDLGIPGLRHFKEQLNPTRFLKKYTISPKSSPDEPPRITNQ